MADQMPPDTESLAPALEGLLSSLPRVKVTPQTISQPIIDGWYKRERIYKDTIATQRAHLDIDHGVMVQLGIVADSAVKMLEHVNMDTDEDRELHARAVGALRGRLNELASAMKEADEAAGLDMAATREETAGSCPVCGLDSYRRLILRMALSQLYYTSHAGSDRALLSEMVDGLKSSSDKEDAR